MKATELMIGNWVYCRESTCQGHRVDFVNEMDSEVGVDGEILDLDMVFPSLLTPEILEKNGFVNRHTIGELYRCDIRLDDEIGGEYISLNYYLYNKLLSIKLAKDYSTCPSVSDLPIQYVHELQNALTLCKIEKEIVL